jgi:2-octaprenyl-6-methoxyphenol hydroxylase
MSNDQSQVWDLVIIGGGLVGVSLACALAPLGLRVAIIEPTPRQQLIRRDRRLIALSLGSQRIFEGLGVWSKMAEESAPINSVHVSEAGRFGVTRIHAAELDVPCLGSMMSANRIAESCYEQLDEYQEITVLTGKFVDQKSHADHIHVTMEASDGVRKELRASLLVAADGMGSRVRENAGIDVSKQAYQQAAVVAEVTHESPHGQVAFERFLSAGPMALLPLSGQRCALVWTWPEDRVETVLSWSDEVFLEQLQKHFGFRLGRFLAVSARASYPLSQVMANELVGERLVLLGNAAHGLHPVAGQGFNLGLRDVALLAELIQADSDPGSEALLVNYAQQRQHDHRLVMRSTHWLVRIFASTQWPLSRVRGLGLITLDRVWPLKNRLMQQAMGLVKGCGKRLIHGLPLRTANE